MHSEINPIIIVDAFFHNDNCIKTFKNYLSFIKKTGLPIMLVTNSKFEQTLIDEVDYILYDNNNRLFKKDYSDIETICMWYNDNYKYFSIATKAFQKHGLSVLSNLYHSTNLALSLGYTHFFRIEYDCNVPYIENIKNIISETQEQDKKGYIYINENKYISFQLWYFALDYFTKIFPKINNEDDLVYFLLLIKKKLDLTDKTKIAIYNTGSTLSTHQIKNLTDSIQDFNQLKIEFLDSQTYFKSMLCE